MPLVDRASDGRWRRENKSRETYQPTIMAFDIGTCVRAPSALSLAMLIAGAAKHVYTNGVSVAARVHWQ